MNPKIEIEKAISAYSCGDFPEFARIILALKANFPKEFAKAEKYNSRGASPSRDCEWCHCVAGAISCLYRVPGQNRLAGGNPIASLKVALAVAG